jgi:predicted ATPase
VTGARAIEALLASQHRKMNRGPSDLLEPLPAIVARWLERMRLIEDFEVRQIAEGRTEYEVLVQTKDTQTAVKLTDVGFGISQVLPVIVECFYVKPNSTVIFEQPEIHLHPSVQADLADLFIDATRIREDARPRNIQFIIESHSEHFLRRLQRRIAEEEIDHDEIAVYFCEASEDGSTIHRLEIDRLGRIANWPKHFFGDMIGDMAAQVRGAINRMKEASDG